MLHMTSIKLSQNDIYNGTVEERLITYCQTENFAQILINVQLMLIFWKTITLDTLLFTAKKKKKIIYNVNEETECTQFINTKTLNMISITY